MSITFPIFSPTSQGETLMKMYTSPSWRVRSLQHHHEEEGNERETEEAPGVTGYERKPSSDWRKENKMCQGGNTSTKIQSMISHTT